MTRIGLWQTGQRSGSTCQTRKIRSRHFFYGRLRGGCGRRDGHAGRRGLPQELNFRRGQAVGLVDEVAEHALQFRGFGGDGAGGLDGAGVPVPQRLRRRASGGDMTFSRTPFRFPALVESHMMAR
jgi:hypothetical protein